MRGAAVQAGSPAKRGRSEATRLDGGEHTPKLSVGRCPGHHNILGSAPGSNRSLSRVRQQFYERLNRILEAAGFDAFVEGLCAPFYAVMGRPSPAPGRYFRLLLIGYFEGLDSERGIAWRAEDSLSMRAFLRSAAPAAPPDLWSTTCPD